MAGHQRSIHRMLRHRAVAANALHFNMQRIGGGHHQPRHAGRSCPTADPAYCAGRRWRRRGTGQIDPSSTITRPPYSNSSAGWKISCSVPVNWRVRARYSGGVKQRGGVPVMAAAVKAPFNLACPRLTAPLLHRQGIHIRPQAKAFFPLADAQRAHHSGARQAAVNLVSPLAKQSGDLAAGLVLFKADLRLLVEPTTQSDTRGLPASLTCNASSNGCVIFVIPVLCLHDTFEFMRVPQLAGALFCFILTKNQ